MREAGVPFLAGTDVGVAFMYPGFSLHDDLHALVQDLWFSRMEALRIVTSNPHAFYHDQHEHGAIAKGQIADLVLLDRDPLLNISNTGRVRGVMLRGRWLDRRSLDDLLAQIQKQAKNSCTTPLQY